MLLRIKLKNPILPRKLNRRRVLLHLLPIRVMPHIPRRLARLLHRLDPLIPYILIRPQRTPHIILPGLSQQHSQRDTIFQRLRSALRARRQERMRCVTHETNATVSRRGAVARHPVWKRVAVHEFPVYELVFGGFGHDAPAHGVPALEHFFHVGQVAGEGPGFVDVVLVAVREDPAAVGAAFEGGEEEVDVWAWDMC